MPPLNVVDHRAWRIGPSYDGSSFQSGNCHIYNGMCLCDDVVILSNFGCFLVFFALLQLGGCFDARGISKVMPTTSSTCTPLLFMLLQSPGLVFLFIGGEDFFTSFSLSTH